MVLAELHDRAPLHSWAASKMEIEKAFGKPVEELFESIDHKALASGSIAQVRLDRHTGMQGLSNDLAPHQSRLHVLYWAAFCKALLFSAC